MNGPLFYPGKNHGHLNGSRLWEHCNLPPPGEGPDEHGGVTIRVEQVAWGHTCRKPTLLYLVGCDLDFVRATIRTGGTPTHGISSKARRGALLAPSSAARRKTPLAFAEWLVAIARTADLSRPFRREPRQIGLFGEGLAAQ